MTISKYHHEPELVCTDHYPSQEQITLDCAPTNEWVTVCENCGVDLWAQNETEPYPCEFEERQ